ncbi:MAG TPA: hypothetical protein VM889_12845 [Candidatus Thermoplasmatota archaeon]|nr:hypothetical protein [Candidatus Thermoplasmatota archaeon]
MRIQKTKLVTMVALAALVAQPIAIGVPLAPPAGGTAEWKTWRIAVDDAKISVHALVEAEDDLAGLGLALFDHTGRALASGAEFRDFRSASANLLGKNAIAPGIGHERTLALSRVATCAPCSETGNVFIVAAWTAGAQPETLRVSLAGENLTILAEDRGDSVVAATMDEFNGDLQVSAQVGNVGFAHVHGARLEVEAHRRLVGHFDRAAAIGPGSAAEYAMTYEGPTQTRACPCSLVEDDLGGGIHAFGIDGTTRGTAGAGMAWLLVADVTLPGGNPL